MRKQSNCAHAFQEVKNKGKKRLQFCLDCSKILYKWQNDLKVGKQLAKLVENSKRRLGKFTGIH